MKYTLIEVRAGQIVKLKGQRTEITNIISKYISSTGKAIIETVDDVPTKYLANIINALSKSESYHLILEGAPQRVGFYFLLNSQVTVFIDRNFLETEATARLIENLLTRANECEDFQVNLLTPEAIEPAVSIIQKYEISNKRLQLDSKLGQFLLQRPQLIQDFNTIKVFESEHHMIIVDRRLGEIRIMRPNATDSTFMLDYIIRLSEKIPSVVVEPDASERSKVLEMIVQTLCNLDLSQIEQIIIERNKVQLCTGQFCATICIETFSSGALLNALESSIESLKACKPVYFLI
ncbi:MAG: hypothetical protein NDP22_01545 [Crenarchaeota archaeon]|nr:hypothetical protein [Thermoproteota archaeon]